LETLACWLMRPVFAWVGILIFLFVGCSEPQDRKPASEPGPAWDPKQTLVLVVGLLNWQDSEEFDSFPTKNRRDAQLADFFLKAGVPKDQVTYLQDKKAPLAEIRSHLKRILNESRPGQTLIVYYCGHGYSSEDNEDSILFACYDAGVRKVKGWSVNGLVSEIDKGFKGDRVMLMADCCQSGGLVDAAKRKNRKLSYACFGASETDKSSTGNWTFTESVLTALRGEGPADLNHDGLVTLDEMVRYIRSEMAFAEDQKSVSILTGDWNKDDVVAQAQPLNFPREGEHVEAFSGKKWWPGRLVGQKNGQFKVFYYGYEVEDEEWVVEKNLRVPKKAAGKTPSGS